LQLKLSLCTPLPGGISPKNRGEFEEKKGQFEDGGTADRDTSETG